MLHMCHRCVQSVVPCDWHCTCVCAGTCGFGHGCAAALHACVYACNCACSALPNLARPRLHTLTQHAFAYTDVSPHVVCHQPHVSGCTYHCEVVVEDEASRQRVEVDKQASSACSSCDHELQAHEIAHCASMLVRTERLSYRAIFKWVPSASGSRPEQQMQWLTALKVRHWDTTLPRLRRRDGYTFRPW